MIALLRTMWDFELGMAPGAIEEMGVLFQVFPRPISDVEWEAVRITLRHCGIDNPGFFQACRDAVVNGKILSLGFNLKIPKKQHLFLSGEVFEARLCGPRRVKHTIPFSYPARHANSVFADDNGKRQNETQAEIRLILCPPLIDSQEFEKRERRKQYKARGKQHWKKISSWLL